MSGLLANSSHRGNYGSSNYGSYGGGYGGSSYGGYGSSYGSGYGSYGGGYAGSYGGSYGRHVAGYGRTNNFVGRIENGEAPVQNSNGGIVDGTFQWINKIQYTTDVLAQFTGLFMMNVEAIYTSYSSFVGLLEGLSHLGYILSGFTVFSMLRNMIYWMLGKRNLTSSKFNQIRQNSSNPLINEFSSAKKSTQRQWTSIFVIFGVLFLGIPLLSLINKKMHKLVEDDEKKSQADLEMQWRPKMAVAIADYRASGPDDIEFLKGDQVLVISKPFAEWWEGEVFSRGQRQRGLFPFNHVEFVPPQSNGQELTLPSAPRRQIPTLPTTS